LDPGTGPANHCFQGEGGGLIEIFVSTATARKSGGTIEKKGKFVDPDQYRVGLKEKRERTLRVLSIADGGNRISASQSVSGR
jgi:hypothetical protein